MTTTVAAALWAAIAATATATAAEPDYSTSATLSVMPGLWVGVETRGPPLIQVQVEQLVLPRFSLAAYGGAYTNLGGWSAGGQARGLVLGGFDANVHLALQGGVVRGRSGGTVAPTGLLLGGKFINEIGLTGEAQIGPVVDLAAEERLRLGTLLNLNFGWSF